LGRVELIEAMEFELMTHEVGRMTVAELAIFFSDMT
jgi:hypothetical protein